MTCTNNTNANQCILISIVLLHVGGSRISATTAHVLRQGRGKGSWADGLWASVCLCLISATAHASTLDIFFNGFCG